METLPAFAGVRKQFPAPAKAGNFFMAAKPFRAGRHMPHIMALGQALFLLQSHLKNLMNHTLFDASKEAGIRTHCAHAESVVQIKL